MNKKIALVTGANRGIGLEVVKQLSELGFFVFLGSRNKDKINDLLKKLNSKAENIAPIIIDVTNEDSIHAAFMQLSKSLKNNLAI